MTEIAFPFDAGPGAVVGETQWQQMARHFLTTGVLTGVENQLAVTAAGTAREVTVASGAAWLRGFHYRNTAPLVLPVAAANPTNPRIDTVVIRLDRAADTVTAAVLTGTPAASPAAPALTQTDDLFELPLANVAVPAAAGVVAPAGVTDRRVFTGPFDSAALALKASKAETVELVDAAGDLLVGGGPDVLARLARGAPGQELRVNAAGTGLEWYTPAAPVADMVKLGEVTLAADAAVMTLSGIDPTGFRSLQLSYVVRGTGAFQTNALYLRLNGSAAGYLDQRVIGQSTAASASGTAPTPAAQINLGVLSAANAYATQAGHGTTWIARPAAAAYKLLHGLNYAGSGPSSSFVAANGGEWQNVDPVSSVSLLASSGNLLAGSSMALYGIK